MCLFSFLVVWAPRTMPGHREILKTHVLIELTNPRNAKTEAAAEILEDPTSEIKVVPPCSVEPFQVLQEDRSALPNYGCNSRHWNLQPLPGSSACEPTVSKAHLQGTGHWWKSFTTIESDDAWDSRGKVLWCFLPITWAAKGQFFLILLVIQRSNLFLQ